MINKKIISTIIGTLLYIEALLLALCSIFGFYYHENDKNAFAISACIAVGAGSLFSLYGRGAERKFGRRDGYIIVSISWIVFSLIGMLPYLLGGYITSVSDAFFETMSGFTTTGASIIDDIEVLPHGILFWRSLTQWIGGLGIVFFTIAVLPVFGAGGVQMFAAEATGPKHDKVHPRIEVNAHWIWSIYLGITVVCAICYIAAGMGRFDGLCHALTTTATGGYSTRNGSIGAYNSVAIEYIATLFMFLSGVNFTLLFYTFFKGRIRKLMKDTEFRWYAGLLIFFTTVITCTLVFTRGGEIWISFREALFQVVSIQTTTGFVSADYMKWPPVLWFLLSIVMYCGACSGSTSGAFKCVRIAMMVKIVRNEFLRIVHPNAVIPLRISNQVIHSRMKITLFAFFMLYVIIIFIGWTLMMAFGLDFLESYSVVVSCVSNTGPALGECSGINSWSHLPDAAKWLGSFLMLAGRLELFSILLLFTPGFWKKR